MLKAKRNKWEVRYHSNINDVDAMPATNHVNYREYAEYAKNIETSSSNRNNSWLGVPNLAEGVKKIENGWDEGVIKAQEILKEFTVPKLPSLKRKSTWRTDRGNLSESRMYNGSVKPFRSKEKRPTDRLGFKGKCCIAINLCSHGGFSASQFFWRGAVASVLAEALQRSGRNCKIIGVIPASGCRRDGGSYLGIFEIKDFQEQVNLSSLFAYTALPLLFRWYGFMDMYSLDQAVTSGLGQPTDIPEWINEYVEDVFMLQIENDVLSKESALRTIKQLASRITNVDSDR